MSTNAIFVVAQRGFSAQVEIKIGIRRDEKIRNARTNSSSGNPLLISSLIEATFYHQHRAAGTRLVLEKNCNNKRIWIDR